MTLGHDEGQGAAVVPTEPLFLLTGFHGLHVAIGATVLAVILARSLRGDFTPDDQFAFQGATWYWQFVDVVWLLLFVLVYWL
jgi:cytochrome c oxidase subunit III